MPSYTCLHIIYLWVKCRTRSEGQTLSISNWKVYIVLILHCVKNYIYWKRASWSGSALKSLVKIGLHQIPLVNFGLHLTPLEKFYLDCALRRCLKFADTCSGIPSTHVHCSSGLPSEEVSWLGYSAYIPATVTSLCTSDESSTLSAVLGTGGTW